MAMLMRITTFLTSISTLLLLGLLYVYYKNLKKLVNIANEIQLKKKLKEKIVKNVTAQKLSYDLKNFFPNQNFVNDFCKNYKKIMEKFLK